MAGRYIVQRSTEIFNETISSHPTLEDAIAAAPAQGEPRQIGTHQWAFPPGQVSTITIVHDEQAMEDE